MQMIAALDKIREKVPEYARLEIKPVFVCIHARPAVISLLQLAMYGSFATMYLTEHTQLIALSG